MAYFNYLDCDDTILKTHNDPKVSHAIAPLVLIFLSCERLAELALVLLS
jgi:hypothetical protein